MRKGNVFFNGRCGGTRMFMKMLLERSRFSGEFSSKTHFLFPHRDKREKHLTTTALGYECAKGARHGRRQSKGRLPALMMHANTIRAATDCAMFPHSPQKRIAVDRALWLRHPRGSSENARLVGAPLRSVRGVAANNAVVEACYVES